MISSSQYLLTVSYDTAYYHKEKRQTAYSNGYYVASSGAASNCQQAAAFELTSNGQLTSNGGYIFAPPGVSYTAFVPGTPTDGDITELFSLVNSGTTLAWNNSAFSPLGYAEFCVIGSTVNACFDGVYPTGCLPVTIGVQTPSQCPGYGGSSSSSVTSSGTGLSSGSSSGSTGSLTGTSTSMSNVSTTSSVSGSSASITTTNTTGSSSTSSSSTSTSSQSGTVYDGSITGDYLGCFLDTSSPPLSGDNTTVSSLEECCTFCEAYTMMSVANGKIFT